MTQQTYRAQARRAWFAAVAVSTLALGGSATSIVVGWRPVRELTATFANACLRAWAMLPELLRLLLVGSAAIGVASAGLWVWSVMRQWRATSAALRTLVERDLELHPRLVQALARSGMSSRVVVFPSPHPVAFTAGLVSPRIGISTALLDALDADELEAVLLHEHSHVRAKDPAYLAVGRALSAAFFYLPIVPGLMRRHQAAVELAADQDVIAAQGGPLGLASAMTKALRLSSVRQGSACFMGATDLRLSSLLERDVRLPAVSGRALLQSALALGTVVVPTVSAYALAGALTSASIILQCPL